MSTELAITWDQGKYEFQRKLGNFVQYFQVNLPTNGFGVPMQLVNPLLLAQNVNLMECETTDDVPDSVLQRAILRVDFDDGLPIIDGVPIWERLDGEHVDYYKLFKEYREMLYVSGSRALTKLANMFNIAGKYLNVLSKVYHWQLRVRAYDVYKKMEYERKRSFERQLLESKHAKVADTLLTQALTYLEHHPEQLNPKIAVQMLQLAIKVGRLSVGLNAEKPGTEDTSINTNININQVPNANAETGVTVDGNPSNTQQKVADVSTLQSILHILDKSGALDKIKPNIVDADYKVVDENEEAI